MLTFYSYFARIAKKKKEKDQFYHLEIYWNDTSGRGFKVIQLGECLWGTDEKMASW